MKTLLRLFSWSLQDLFVPKTWVSSFYYINISMQYTTLFTAVKMTKSVEIF